MVARVDDHSVKEEGLARTVLAGHTDDSDGLADSRQKLLRFLTNQILFPYGIELDHVDRLPILNYSVHLGGNHRWFILDRVGWLHGVLGINLGLPLLDLDP